MITQHATHEDRDAPRTGAVGGRFGEPVLQLDLARESRRLREHESWRREGRTARTLVKTETLRVVLVEMRAGSRLGRHHTGSRFCLQVVAGSVSVMVPGTDHLLTAGQLVAVDASIAHDVEALEDSTFLLTLARES